MAELNINGYKYTYDRSSEAARKTVETIIVWCNKYKCNNGEMLCQNDDCIIESPYLIAEIIDNVLKFNCKYED